MERMERSDSAPRLGPWAYLGLRPYGDRLSTPAVDVWLGFARILILLMAGLEGLVWGIVGASLVPEASPMLAPIAAATLFTLIFAVVWIVDASLIMSERPTLSERGPGLSSHQGLGSSIRWLLGLAARVGIVAVSLYVTAPFLTKIIRADDIERWHDAKVEQYYQRREQTLQEQIGARAAQVQAQSAAHIQDVEAQIARLTSSLDAEQRRRATIEAQYAPEVETLRASLTEARTRFGDELVGRNDRPEGYGPEARKWEARAAELERILAEKQSEIAGRIGDTAQRINDQQQRLGELTRQLDQLRAQQQQRMEQAAADLAAKQPEQSPPRLTFAARSKALAALREGPDEAGVPHFETVDGFAQAALAILFFSLIALKLFEPAAVRAYFNEVLQYQYWKYRDGGLADTPGFDGFDDPKRRLNPIEFVRAWHRFQADPAGFLRGLQAGTAVVGRMRLEQAEERLELDLLERRRARVDQRLAYERERNAHSLAAFDRELAQRHEQLARDLAEESASRQERELRQQEQAREERRLREKELDQALALREEELRQAQTENQRQHEERSTRLQAQRRREERRERVGSLRDALAAMRTQISGRQAEQRQGLEALRGVREEIGDTDAEIARIDAAVCARRARAEALEAQLASRAVALQNQADAPKTKRWPFTRRDPRERQLDALRHDLERLKAQIGVEEARLVTLRGSVRTLRAQEQGLPARIDALNQAIELDRERVEEYERAIDTLLLGAVAPDDSADAPAGDLMPSVG